MLVVAIRLDRLEELLTPTVFYAFISLLEPRDRRCIKLNLLLTVAWKEDLVAVFG